MLKLLRFLKGSAIICAILAPIMMMLEVAMDLMQPKLMADIIDIGIANGDTTYILSLGGKMIIFSILGLIGGIGCTYFSAYAGMHMGENLRAGMFEKIQALSFLEIDKFKTSSLITRLTNDVTQVQNMFMMALRIMVRAPFMCIGGLVMAFALSMKLSIIFVIAMPVILIAMTIILKKSMPLFTSMQSKIDNVNLVMRENILGIRVIKAFTLEGKQREKFDATNKDLMDTSIKAQNMSMILWPVVTLVMNLSVIAVFWYGGNLAYIGGIEAGKIMAFINYLLQIMNSLVMVVMIMLNFSRAKASADRVNEVLEAESSIKDKTDTKDFEAFDVEFRNVSFKYHEHSEAVLHNVSFKIKQGQTVGIIGSTGSGKSSLVGLIPRLYDATEGEVLIGGTNVKDLSLQSLRKNIGVILQDSILFSGTIESNLKFGNNEADINTMEDAARDAQAYEFIINKEDKFNSVVEQRGKNLSGGQKQRLSITRTLVRNPKILIMDDASSALDMATEARLLQALKQRMKSSTVFMIAQRISGVMDADQIIVMDDGHIVGIGTHEQLLAANDIYRSIAVSQLGEEVLENVSA
ncbi:ABC transporter ATP-binding protein [Zhenhengia yiwuensis]|uniref:ABC transporter ATP-binding protein n=1 Tax=Zhenhengia yiwuensis TaxID=2763666 RepID=A0A926EH87_9FIRM|nr:ABC transporter ATP-binding protein [Zhenhengia yiwuensis]MBC8578427.1 ABC transporter ATP-binding protein [Zhenhengia yiwuensis]MBS5798447.1 ABC transporter ATP-binding protein [Clostridiales bacterium]